MVVYFQKSSEVMTLGVSLCEHRWETFLRWLR